jgi:P2 family phage contractile tail tube protein
MERGSYKMAMYKPQTLVDANVWVNGKHHLGVSSKVKLPEIEFLKTEQKAGGFEREIFNGILGKLEGEITFRVFSDKAFEAVQKAYQTSDHAEILIKASYYQNGKKYPIVANWKGNVNIEDKEFEAGGEVERTLKMSIVVADLSVNGKQEYQIDSDNMVCIIRGKDLLADLRSQIM